MVFARTAAEVLRIVYLDRSEDDPGGFFPRGINGGTDGPEEDDGQ